MSDILEFLQRLNLEPKRVASTKGGEYHSPCPACGGRDRFVVWPNRPYKNCVGGYFCRQCDKSGDVISFCREFLGMSWKEAVAATHATISPKLDSSAPAVIRPKFRPCSTPPQAWSLKAEEIVSFASYNIQKRADILEYLERRGLPLPAVEKFRIGFVDNPDDRNGSLYLTRSEVSLERGKPVWIPRGIIIPSIDPSGKISRLKIRRSDYSPKDKYPKYVVVSGGADGMSLIGCRKHDAVIVVESELDGYAVCHAVGDRALVVAVGTNNTNPDLFTNLLALEGKSLLICHDNDKAGAVMLQKWKKLYSHAVAYPPPHHKDIGEAVENGLNLREWLLAALEA